MFQRYGKFIVALAAALIMAGFAAYRDAAGDNVVTPSEWVLVVIALFTAIQVWAATNIPSFSKAKTLFGAIGLVLSLLVSAIVGGITTDEGMFLAIQFLGALGIAGAPAPVHREVSRTTTTPRVG